MESQEQKIRKGQAFNLAVNDAIHSEKQNDPRYIYQQFIYYHELEAVQKISDEPLVRCPACKKKSLEKLISTGGFILKGEGFYRRSE